MDNRSDLFYFIGTLVMVGFLLFGCSSGGGDTATSLTGDGSTTATATDLSSITMTQVASPGALGPLQDTGDLVASGDNWYYTKIFAIGDDGSVVGQTSATSPVNAAFLRDAGTNTMIDIGIHAGTYDGEVDGPPFIYSEAVGIGPGGDVIGNSTTGTGWPDETEKRAFYWNSGVFVDLHGDFAALFPPDETGDFSEARFINGDYVLFTIENGEGKKNAWYWNKIADTYGVLGRILGATLTEPVGINRYNQAVVNSEGSTVVFHDLDVDVIQSLNHLPGASTTTAVAINDSQPTGHVVGTSGAMAFFWDGGSMYPCGNLGGGTSEATDLNNLDQVVGFSTTASGATHAFVWALDASGIGRMTDLGTLGGTNSWATAINDNGLIVGYSETGEIYSQGGVTQTVVHACAWYGNVIYDLGIHNDFYAYPFVQPYPFSEAIDVNDSNRIAGNSFTINSHYRGFVIDASIP
jgi:probable HAF family extracellular repeat protein